MPNNPYDDLLKSLVKLLEQITSLEQNMRKMQDPPQAKPGIIGCAIFTGGALHQNPEIFRCRREQKAGLTYEMVDAGMTAYLTVQLPPHLCTEPCVEFYERRCSISTNGLSGSIDLQFSIIPESSSWTFCNGVLDLALKKQSEEPEDIDSDFIPGTEFF
ncbi:MAG: hypothetical protein BWY45_03282 [Euryarchaeota archaeon ADurb.Bin294]|jgi:hypothetical protein|nr:hypothetical protein [Methanomicrobiales archaeon]OQA51873.1 MAG: hypothetical protein BWY45_03282 [Euryarchaeota archaeon ADurb.Bin294]